jgi:hypothetical protein
VFFHTPLFLTEIDNVSCLVKELCGGLMLLFGNVIVAEKLFEAIPFHPILGMKSNNASSSLKRKDWTGFAQSLSFSVVSAFLPLSIAIARLLSLYLRLPLVASNRTYTLETEAS